MKVVVDANVFISSFYWKGKPRKIIERVTDGHDEAFITADILEEIQDVMSRPKFKTDSKAIQEYIRTIKNAATIIDNSASIDIVSRDKDDDKILDCAKLAQADFIISGDKDLLVLNEYAGIFIVTPSYYLDLV
jgi:putative PIN family toxin of toxin-antitoxin system